LTDYPYPQGDRVCDSREPSEFAKEKKSADPSPIEILRDKLGPIDVCKDALLLAKHFNLDGPLEPHLDVPS
jgi:hypothetical protein